MDIAEIHLWKGSEEWFNREKSDVSIDPSKVIYATQVLVALHADTHPNVWGPPNQGGKLRQSIRSLGEYLEPMPVSLSHDPEHPLNELNGHVLVEEITHGVDEDSLGLLPTKR
jgi:hypothetical protein